MNDLPPIFTVVQEDPLLGLLKDTYLEITIPEQQKMTNLLSTKKRPKTETKPIHYEDLSAPTILSYHLRWDTYKLKETYYLEIFNRTIQIEFTYLFLTKRTILLNDQMKNILGSFGIRTYDPMNLDDHITMLHSVSRL